MNVRQNIANPMVSQLATTFAGSVEQPRGRPVSPGFTSGSIVAHKPIETPSCNPSSDPAIEAKALLETVAGALAVQVQMDGKAAGMVAFQAAMLEGAELVWSASDDYATVLVR